ncbi:MAG: hypothetical protein JW929_02765 [Anaerolineales bacterium]|nr:hypothetical protein [Anaerolineales bacterium]
MILLIVLLLLSLGALATFFVPPEKRSAHIAVSLIPLAAMGMLLLPIRLPASLSIAWSPPSLFPDPLLFTAGPSAVVFAVFFCGLLLLIEWTRPMRQSPGRTARAVIYWLAVCGILACFAANPLAVILAWALIDISSFLAVFFMKSPVVIGMSGIAPSVSHAMGIFSANMLGSVFVFFSQLAGSGSLAGWSLAEIASTPSISSVLFFCGILLRVAVSPLQFSVSHIQTPSTGTDVFLRVVSPAAGLCLLAGIWPAADFSTRGVPVFFWAVIPLLVLLLVGGWQWSASVSAYGRRGDFLYLLPLFILLSAVIAPRTEGLFLAGGGLLILGGGILLLYLGFLPHRRWTAAFLVLLGLFFSGAPFTPLSAWSSSVYPGLFSFSGFPVLLALAVSQIFILGALFRSAFESVETFPPNEPLFLTVFSMGMAAAFFLLCYPGWPGPSSLPAFAAPVLLLLGGGSWMALVRRFQRTETSLFRFLVQTLRLEGLQRGVSQLFRGVAGFFSGVEGFLSGEGAMLWSLGLALLFYLVLRGG